MADMSGKLKEWGSFLNEIEQLKESLQRSRKKERNPYRQYEIDEQIKTAEACEALYREYLDKGLPKDLSADAYGSQLGQTYLRELEKLDAMIVEKSNKDLDEYIVRAFGMKRTVVRKVQRQFKGYILKP